MSTETAPATGTFCWNELMTPDVDAAKGFYTQLFGWESKEMDMRSVLRPMVRVAPGLSACSAAKSKADFLLGVLVACDKLRFAIVISPLSYSRTIGLSY